MGSIGTVTSSMSIDNFKIEEKKWDARERKNLENAINFMSQEFGDISDLIGTIYKRSSINASGLYDREGFHGRGRATYFDTGGFASEDLAIHEFTHAVTEEIANHYRELGYKNENEVFSAMRTEVHQNLGKEERKYDGRRWRDRPAEFLSRNLEGFESNERNHISDESKETLKVIKKWFKKIGR